MVLITQVVPALHPPETDEVHVAGTYTLTIPAWVNYVDLWVVGAGGSGGVGDGVGNPGTGGSPGTWLWGTFSRAAGDFPPGMVITIVIGSGGASVPTLGPGNAGGASSLSAPSWSGYNVPGGGGGSDSTGDSTGSAAGSETVNGVTYNGGAAVATGANGNAPGGGGGGGEDGVFSSGAGGDGGAQFVLRAA